METDKQMTDTLLLIMVRLSISMTVTRPVSAVSKWQAIV